MLKQVSHASGVQPAEEILFSTPFNYLFPDLARSEAAKLPVQTATIRALLSLGDAMADLGTPNDSLEDLDSDIPAVFTYLGQFIDHDITARTDRETGISEIAGTDSNAAEFEPAAPDEVIAQLKNGRRPQLDLDSVYGDGPGLLGADVPGAATEAQFLYEDNLLLKVQTGDRVVDVPRVQRQAQIADRRNDENVIVSQLHTAFLKFHNAIACGLPQDLSDTARYAQARRLVRWAYQYVVVNDYLKAVAAPSIVDDIVCNGPRFFRPGYSGGAVFMPLEFSVAGFRFGHSMIRPFYQLNRETQANVMDLLGVSRDREPEQDLLENSSGQDRLKPAFRVDWDNFVSFVPKEPLPNLARKIDPLIAKGLFNMALEGAPPNSMLSHLAQRNLLRGYSLSLPTGQAIAKTLGLEPLGADILIHQEKNPRLKEALEAGGFGDRTPLWYYILKESALQTQGCSLGAVGSTLVAETLIGLVKQDPNSYLNNPQDEAVTPHGIGVPPANGISVIATIGDLLIHAGVR